MATTDNKSFGMKQRIFSGALWTFFGFGATQVLKFASILILARMLSPADYGLISIVTVVLVGITMVSDLGFGPNVMQNERGEDEDFLNSIWSMQIVKGFLVWFLCILLSWPISYFYQQPILMPIMIVSTFASVLSGFNSTGVYSTDRNIDLKKQTIFQFLSQFISLAIMITIAYFNPSVWVLVTGGLVTAGIYAYLSHHLVPMTNKWHWDPETNKKILTFGKWVAISSTMGFIVIHSAPLILGKFLTMTKLGLFSNGVNLARVVEGINFTIIQKVVTPVIAKTRDESNHSVRQKLTKIKLALISLFLPGMWIMIIFAPEIIGIMFDERYQDAAWVMQVYSIALIPMVISGLGQFYLVLGDNKLLANLTFFKTLSFFVLVFGGWYLNQGNGIIVGVCLYNTASYFVELYGQIKYKVWIAWLDVTAFALSALVLWFGLSQTGNGAILVQKIMEAS